MSCGVAVQGRHAFGLGIRNVGAIPNPARVSIAETPDAYTVLRTATLSPMRRSLIRKGPFMKRMCLAALAALVFSGSASAAGWQSLGRLNALTATPDVVLCKQRVINH